MVYLAGEIILFLIAAAIIGFIIGWLLRGNRAGSAAAADLEAAGTENRRLAEEVSALRAAGGDLETRIAEISADCEERIASLSSERDTAQRRLEGLESGSAEAEERAAALGTELERARQRIIELEAETTGLHARVGELEAAASGGRPSADQERRLTDADAEIERLRGELAASRDRLLAARARAGEVGEEEAREAVISRFAAGAGTEPDDLTAIWGVGPKLESLLHSLNIRTFRQVAEFTAEDIAIVDAALTAFRGRIVRDDWVGSARAAHEEKYGGPV
jgi:predicted flap endonuclease-1-like 5' DNA nuclease